MIPMQIAIITIAIITIAIITIAIITIAIISITGDVKPDLVEYQDPTKRQMLAWPDQVASSGLVL